ncbi:hypothetical protein [Sphingosinicella humi]|uniref:Uncharacterized protein n=1 Tax=Allosphingosinicella humi TaxID=2068657 RepID=A0A2U2J109_9SPHN|nr:hypothetical protein [Sphingosinicella humi]PWG01971.1 hypothetical protein DF286_03135 [Sphingosinicella humi]
MDWHGSLEETVLEAFQHACDSGRLDVAEHLLCALERLEGGSLLEDVEGGAASRLAAAYLRIVGGDRN